VDLKPTKLHSTEPRIKINFVQNASGSHPTSYPMGTRGSFHGGKESRVWSWPLTSIQCRGQRM